MELRTIFQRESCYKALREAIAEGCSAVALTGLSQTKKMLLLSALEAEGRTVLFVAADEREAGRVRTALAALRGSEVPFFPMNDYVFTELASHSHEWEAERLAALAALTKGERLVVTTCDAVCRRTPPPEELRGGCRTLREGEEVDAGQLLALLQGCGYERTELIEGPGQFALRGGIVDVYPPDSEAPLRLEFFGDEIDTISYFDPVSQRRTSRAGELSLTPARERAGGARLQAALEEELSVQKRRRKPEAALAAEQLERDIDQLRAGVLPPSNDRFYNLIYDKVSTIYDYLPEGAAVVVSETARQKERLRSFHQLLMEDVQFALEKGRLTERMARNLALSPTEFWRQAGRFPLLYLDAMPTSAHPVAPSLRLEGESGVLPGCGGNLDLLRDSVKEYLGKGYAVLALAAGEKRARNLADILRQSGLPARRMEESLPAPGEVGVCDLPLTEGVTLPEQKLVLLTDGVPASTRKRARKPAKHAGEKLRTYADVRVGDYVVHASYGVGQYLGIHKLTVDGVTRDYLKIQYAGSDVLYVPAAQLDLVYKYVAAGDREHVRLNKMGGGDWQKTKARVKKAVAEMADELIALYAEREKLPGHAFPPDSDWQREFEERFDYEETDDQLRCIKEIKADMQRPVPMDRLLCGDVGFGKTEVALRAAFKCVEDGKQVAILVPTTILANQHYETIRRRFSGYPIKADVLSRFRSAKQQQQTLRELRAGALDIVVGTHRLLQKDVRFKDLGLVIIDEEQRFGVSHKEKLKQLTKEVDVLTLTATPIPRTLNMALTGIRDMSVIEEAPHNRTPVQTYVIEHDMGLIAEAIRKELRRGGQVFYLHNRVASIESTAAKLQALLPDAVIDVGHGQMGDAELSKVWQGVVSGDTDVLVCTTIIETGVDIPNANTLIIENADQMGLSQLYQIRGRVGRSDRRAYVYFTYRKDKSLTEDASKRLEAIKEFTEFGSGFKIALRDLEIRGAGNLLGAQQHGHMESVGYDMYVKLLDEAVAEKRGEKRTAVECQVDLFVDAHIPDSYIESAEQRIDMYKKIAAISHDDDLSDLLDELCDRYGDPPKPVYTLCRIALLRGKAGRLGIPAITSSSGNIVQLEVPDMSLETVSKLISRSGKGVFYSAGDKPMLTISLKKGEELIARCDGLLTTLAELTSAE